MKPCPKPPKHKKRTPKGRLINKALQDQNDAILERDGHCCACCGCSIGYLPDSCTIKNEWPVHHIMYHGHTKLDLMIFKMTVCETCHFQLHQHHVWDTDRWAYVPMGSKADTQAWCVAKIISNGINAGRYSRRCHTPLTHHHI